MCDVTVKGEKFALTTKLNYTRPTINALTEAYFSVVHQVTTNLNSSVDS